MRSVLLLLLIATLALLGLVHGNVNVEVDVQVELPRHHPQVQVEPVDQQPAPVHDEEEPAPVHNEEEEEQHDNDLLPIVGGGNACDNIGGHCTTSCSGGAFHTGLCPGAANIRCCVKKSSSKPSHPSSGGNHGCNINSASLNLVKSFEGFRAYPYRDSVGVRTIGYGCTSACNGMSHISEHDAAVKLSQMLQNSYGSCVRDRVKHHLTENQYGALTSFVYNLGCGALSGNLLNQLNSGNFHAATSNMKTYCHAGGQVLAGLVRRRNAEVALFNKKSNMC